MHATPITVIGNAVTTPERRKTESGLSVASFRVASTERRYDRDLGAWADGRSLYLHVNCWRALADNVHRSVVKGDPVVITGQLYTREYEVDGQRRSSFEIEADAIGLNLAKGTSAFSRTRSTPPTFEVANAADGVATDLEPELEGELEPVLV
jgi:single-strand DNA-binding protein